MNTIIKLVKAYRPDATFKLCKDIDGDDMYIMYFNCDKSTGSIDKNSSWIDIKKYIDSSTVINKICTCNNNIANVGCMKCSFKICKKCYINTIRENTGIFKCNNCKYMYGKKMNFIDLLMLEDTINFRQYQLINGTP